jgi:hypothetical protein
VTVNGVLRTMQSKSDNIFMSHTYWPGQRLFNASDYIFKLKNESYDHFRGRAVILAMRDFYEDLDMTAAMVEKVLNRHN